MSLPRCPYCNTYLTPYGEGKYTCPGCGRSFHLENDKIKDSMWKNVSGLKQRLRYAEKTYDDAFRILSHLESEDNRKFLAEVLNKAGYENIKPSDFEGAKLAQREKKEVRFDKKYGFRVYPITILIAYEKSDEVMQKLQDDPNFRYGGVDIRVEAWPFGALGGIRLEFPKTSGSFTAKHEDFHGTFEIYRKGREKYSDVADLIEENLLDEINSYRHEIISICTKELGVLERKDLENYWNEKIKARIMDYYLPLYIKKIEKKYNEKEIEDIKLLVKNDLEKAIPTFIELQLAYDESILSKILLKSRNLNDIVLWWHLRKNILDQWQGKAIKARENDVKQLIVKMHNLGSDFFSIKEEIRWKVLVYWRFIGDPDDIDKIDAYVDKLIKEALHKTDAVKGLEKEFEDLEKEEEIEGKKEAEGVEKDLEALEEEEGREEAEEVEEIGKELDEI